VSRHEFEEVLCGEPLDLDYQVKNGEERYKALGATQRGRVLIVDSARRPGACHHGLQCGGGVQKAVPEDMNMRSPTKKRVIPAFASEAEEAEWWYKNRRRLDADFHRASKQGTLKALDRKTLLARLARSKAAKVVSIRLPESDLLLAREQAAELGLPYQTYIKSVLHQALVQRAQ
jgi:predicted DNA binding CopG/RHH family protein